MQAAHDSTVRSVLDKYAMLRKAVADHNQGLQQLLRDAGRGASVPAVADFMQVS